MKTSRLPLLVALTAVLLAACVPSGNGYAQAVHLPGFWLGLWHGFIAPLTFALSLFFNSIGMYEVANNGGWYNFGFLIGLGLLHGGGAAGRHARRRRRTTDR